MSAVDWREYQQTAAEFFADLGMDTEIEAELAGARGKHAADVAVRFTAYGIEHLWIVECKLWKKAVKKEQVLVLQGVVDDVGADRGFLLSESNFQSGAVTAARLSNITLSDLADLRANAHEDLVGLRWQEVYSRLARSNERLRELTVVTKREPTAMMSVLKPGMTSDDFHLRVANLSMIEHGLERAKLRRTPIVYGFNRDDTRKIAASVEDFLAGASEVLDEIETWLDDEIAKPWPNKPPEAKGQSPASGLTLVLDEQETKGLLPG
jgi:hypothetical protein